MNIQWTKDLQQNLHEIVGFLNRSGLGETFEKVYLYFVNKHKKFRTISDYSMEFLDSPDNISRGEYRLAFLCQLVNDKKKTFYNPYKCFCHSINYFLKAYWNASMPKTDNNISYIVQILSEFWPKIDLYELTLATNFIKNLVCLSINWSNIGYIYTNCENIRLDFIQPDQKRNFLKILKTSRTFYLRLLLLTAQEINLQKIIWSRIHKKIVFNNYDEMKETLSLSCVVISLLLSEQNYRLG
jgi:hypothetical protein